ncbi:MAG: hypothetical protein JOZ52_04590, partial [Acidobacteria bacterium]|nr:hypothetical protein [Acidobacteriota bacterium]
MAEAATDQLKLINVSAPLARMLLIIPVALVLLGAFLAARWYVGNTLADFAPDADEGGVETTRKAIGLAPSDPLVYLAAANQEMSTLDPSRRAEAVRLYEQSVRLSPNDYRLWLALGRAREQSGDSAGGEKALRRAVELAPTYAYPHWYLGNLLLRAGRTDEAFTELRRAAESNPTAFRPLIFDAAWNIYDKDVQAIERVVGADANVRAQLATFLATHERAEDAVRLWKSLSKDEKQAEAKTGEALLRALFDKKQYRAAQELARDLGVESGESVGRFANGGFESEIKAAGASLFGWQINSVAQTEVAVDTNQHHGGTRSLRIIFDGFSKPGYYNITQVVAVEPATRYRFEGYVRTQDLKSGGTPLIE